MATLSPLQWQFLDDDGKPLDGCKLYSYAAGTLVEKATYTDASGETAHENPIEYDAGGKSIVWLGSGSYDFYLKDKNDILVEEWHGVNGVDKLVNVSTISELRALSAGGVAVVSVAGHTSAADGGQGQFYWNPASTKTDDDATVIQPTSQPEKGRWERLINNSIYNPLWWGEKTGQSIELACTAAYSNNGIVEVSRGDYSVNVAGADFKNIPLKIVYGSKLVISVGCAPSNVNIYDDPNYQIFSCSYADTPSYSADVYRPEHFGDCSADDTSDLISNLSNKLYTAFGGGCVVLSPRIYKAQKPVYHYPNVRLIGDSLGRSKIQKTTNTVGTLGNRTYFGRNDNYNVDAVISIVHENGGAGSQFSRNWTIENISVIGLPTNYNTYGIYIPRAAYAEIKNVNINYCLNGIFTYTMFMSTIHRVIVTGNSTVDGFVHADDTSGQGTGTSMKYINCYANGCKVGFNIFGLTYSSIDSCGVDGANLNSYRFLTCLGVVVNGVGAEAHSGLSGCEAIYVSSSRMTVNGMRAYAFTGSSSGTHAMIFITSNSQVVFNGGWFDDFSTANTAYNIICNDGAHTVFIGCRLPTNGNTGFGYSNGSTATIIDAGAITIKDIDGDKFSTTASGEVSTYNLLKNADFRSGINNGWVLATAGGAVATGTGILSSSDTNTTDATALYCAKIVVSNAGSAVGNVELRQSLSPFIKNGKYYAVKLRIKSTISLNAEIDIQKLTSPYTLYKYKGLSLSANTWYDYKGSFLYSGTSLDDAALRLMLGAGASVPYTVYIDAAIVSVGVSDIAYNPFLAYPNGSAISAGGIGMYGVTAPASQPAHIADATVAAGATPTKAEFDALVTKFNTLLANVENVGIQATA